MLTTMIWDNTRYIWFLQSTYFELGLHHRTMFCPVNAVPETIMQWWVLMPTKVWERLFRDLSFLRLGNVPIGDIREFLGYPWENYWQQDTFKGRWLKNRDPTSFDSQIISLLNRCWVIETGDVDPGGLLHVIPETWRSAVKRIPKGDRYWTFSSMIYLLKLFF